jgi:DNA polymerase I-like protein with 3'-5' exonuclease and polymerase domains
MDNEKIINSWEDLQADVVEILTAFNNNKNLQIAALANPMLALEELGYSINPSIKLEIEDRLRFKTKAVVTFKALRETIYNAAGKTFNIRSQEELEHLLFEDLQLVAFDDRGCPLPKHIRKKRKKEEIDDLAAYAELHPIIDSLLKFRELDTSVPPFCNRAEYMKIRSGEVRVNSFQKLHFRLKQENK